MQTGLKSHVIPFPYYSPLLAVGTLGFSCPPPLSPVSETFQMDVYAPVSLSPSWQMYYFAEFLALQHHKWLWNWLLSLVHLHHQCRQQERCAWLEEHVCVRKLLQSLRESTDAGFWCDACKRLKRDFRKAGYSCLQITGLWSSEFSSFSQGDTRFQSSICIWNSPITLFHVFISHLIAPHQHKPPNLLQLFSLPKCPWISAICFSFSYILIQMLHDVQDWIKSCSVPFSDPKASFLAEDQRSLACYQNHCPLHVQRWADANKSLTTTPLSLMDLASGHTA